MVSGLKANRRGEGWWMKMLVLEFVATKGPSSGLRPPSPILLRLGYAGQEKAKTVVIPLFVKGSLKTGQHEMVKDRCCFWNRS